MADVKFYKIDLGARTCEQILALITSIDAIINELTLTALRSVANGDIAEYDIETGQTTTRVKYSSTKTVWEAINGYEKLRQKYQNKLTPRKVQLIHGKNWRRT